MNNAEPAPGTRNRRTIAGVALAVAMAILLSLNPMLCKRGVFMAKMAGAEEQKGIRDRTLPPARNPKEAVEEEYRMARQQGTVQALELFIARHGDDPLAEQARADLRRVSK